MNSVNSCTGKTKATLARSVLVKRCDRVGISNLVKPKTVASCNNIILLGTNYVRTTEYFNSILIIFEHLFP